MKSQFLFKAVFVALTALFLFSCTKTTREQKNTVEIEIYTNIDILYIDIDKRHLTSESGKYDIVFQDLNKMKEYISELSAEHSNLIYK